MNMAAWNPHTMSEPLINEIRKHPALWDFTLPSNKDKHLKETLWKHVANALKWPESDHETVEGKWKNLRTTYQRERQKIIKGLPSGSGASGTSTWAYFAIMDEFLSKPDPHHTVTISNMTTPGMTFPVSIPAAAAALPSSSMKASLDSMPLGTSGLPGLFDDIQIMPSPTCDTPSKKKRSKKEKKEPSSSASDELIKDAISAFEASERKPIDEMTAFGDFVGSALRGMEELKAHEAQLEILQIIHAKRY